MVSNEIIRPAAALREAEPNSQAQRAAPRGSPALLRLALGAGCIAASMAYAWTGMGGEPSLLLALATAFGAYMAMNVGANDVANNLGPAVVAQVMTLGTALRIAAGCSRRRARSSPAATWCTPSAATSSMRGCWPTAKVSCGR